MQYLLCYITQLVDLLRIQEELAVLGGLPPTWVQKLPQHYLQKRKGKIRVHLSASIQWAAEGVLSVDQSRSHRQSLGHVDQGRSLVDQGRCHVDQGRSHVDQGRSHKQGVDQVDEGTSHRQRLDHVVQYLPLQTPLSIIIITITMLIVKNRFPAHDALDTCGTSLVNADKH